MFPHRRFCIIFSSMSLRYTRVSISVNISNFYHERRNFFFTQPKENVCIPSSENLRTPVLTSAYVMEHFPFYKTKDKTVSVVFLLDLPNCNSF